MHRIVPLVAISALLLTGCSSREEILQNEAMADLSLSEKLDLTGAAAQ